MSTEKAPKPGEGEPIVFFDITLGGESPFLLPVALDGVVIKRRQGQDPINVESSFYGFLPSSSMLKLHILRLVPPLTRIDSVIYRTEFFPPPTSHDIFGPL